MSLAKLAFETKQQKKQGLLLKTRNAYKHTEKREKSNSISSSTARHILFLKKTQSLVKAKLVTHVLTIKSLQNDKEIHQKLFRFLSEPHMFIIQRKKVTIQWDTVNLMTCGYYHSDNIYNHSVVVEHTNRLIHSFCKQYCCILVHLVSSPLRY